MNDYKAIAGKLTIETFEKMFTVEGLNRQNSVSAFGGTVTLSSRGDLAFHRWTPVQLRCLSECALFLARRLEGVHSSDCATHNLPDLANGPCDCGVRVS